MRHFYCYEDFDTTLEAEDIAHIMGVTVETVETWIENGELEKNIDEKEIIKFLQRLG